MDETSYKLDELAAAAGISPRTVRYYVQRGLLPAPVFKGRDTAYDDEHLLRLRAIKHLQEHFLPLDAIQAELARRSREELEGLVAGGEGSSPIPDLPPLRAPFPPHAPLPAGERFIRHVIRPGLEIHLSERADAATRALCERLLNHEKGEVSE
jgi:Ca-activated chloride channel family protein